MCARTHPPVRPVGRRTGMVVRAGDDVLAAPRQAGDARHRCTALVTLRL
jgi:hypothetical protein